MTRKIFHQQKLALNSGDAGFLCLKKGIISTMDVDRMIRIVEQKLAMRGTVIMKSRVIIYISIFGFLMAVILSNMNETQDKEYMDDGTRQLEVGGQLEETEATDLFLHLPVDW